MQKLALRHAHADRGSAGQTQHRRLGLERHARIARPQLAGRRQLMPARIGDDAVLQAARQREEQFIALSVERERERMLPLHEQRRDASFECRT